MIGCVAPLLRAPLYRLFNLPELGESELASPDFPLAAETVSTDQLEPENVQKAVSSIGECCWKIWRAAQTLQLVGASLTR